jgi:hypothetical protein
MPSGIRLFNDLQQIPAAVAILRSRTTAEKPNAGAVG